MLLLFAALAAWIVLNLVAVAVCTVAGRGDTVSALGIVDPAALADPDPELEEPVAA